MDRFHFMGKEELLNGMITGIFFRTVDIPVNRDNKISAYRAFKAAKEKLSQGSSMIMFPEGGISNEYPPKVQEFKNGPFRLAIDAQVSIIPVTSLNTWKVFWDDGNERGSRPGVCRIFVHKPIATHNYQPSDASALEEKVFGVIKEKFLEA